MEWLCTCIDPADMTREEYASAYLSGYTSTARWLASRGLSGDTALETAQAAWARGWERLAQLRDSKTVLTWVNTIALNLYRTSLRHPIFEQLAETLPLPSTQPTAHLAAIDVDRILSGCKSTDRVVLQRRYIEGYRIREIARAHGCSEGAVRIRLLRARRSLVKGLARGALEGDLCTD
jgi:RNA polymerase sigma factor (sigma-70 family)